MIELLEFRYTNDAKTTANLLVRVDAEGSEIMDGLGCWILPIPGEATPAEGSPYSWYTHITAWASPPAMDGREKRDWLFPLVIRRIADSHDSEDIPVQVLKPHLWQDARGRDTQADVLVGMLQQAADKPGPEQVDHPAHYGGADDPYETIKVLRAWLTPEELRGFVKGNAIKYLSRAARKGNPAQDAEKAAWYARELAKL